MAALLWVAVARHHDALSWSYYYFAISMLAAVVSVWRVRRESGTVPTGRSPGMNGETDSTSRCRRRPNQPSEVRTSRLSPRCRIFSIAGVYAAASRIVAAAGIPVSALLYSAYVRFFQAGVAGPRASARLAVRLLPVGVGLGRSRHSRDPGLGSSRPARPRPQLHRHRCRPPATGAPTRIFAPSIALGLDVLVSTGHTGLRTVAQIAMPPVNILLCCLLVPSHGVSGAAVAALLTHVSLAMATWTIVGALVRQQTPDPASSERHKRPCRAIR